MDITLLGNFGTLIGIGLLVAYRVVSTILKLGGKDGASVNQKDCEARHTRDKEDIDRVNRKIDRIEESLETISREVAEILGRLKERDRRPVARKDKTTNRD